MNGQEETSSLQLLKEGLRGAKREDTGVGDR